MCRRAGARALALTLAGPFTALVSDLVTGLTFPYSGAGGRWLLTFPVAPPNVARVEAAAARRAVRRRPAASVDAIRLCLSGDSSIRTNTLTVDCVARYAMTTLADPQVL